jgi:broad specificity phosphatase PhoE
MTGSIQWMRHGTCEDGYAYPAAHARPDSPLSHQGRVEVIAAAERLRASPDVPLAVASSPLSRALETATILAAILGSPVAAPEPAFAEWRAPYCVHWLAPADYPAEYRAWKTSRASQPETSLPGGESLSAFADRARLAAGRAQALAGRYERVLIVSHRLLIGAVAALDDAAPEPAELFTAASTFQLAPAHTWPALKGLR